ncbi:FliO/MopB family protein [Thermorudis peleae]|uniref:FliO/MopB family protein n=1 Tax=Thermorudis peleae TaxID=1382356 RepID=UPI0005716767|nr:flagellar biosynthetic protein FliO [Thermorudis peleae]
MPATRATSTRPSKQRGTFRVPLWLVLLLAVLAGLGIGFMTRLGAHTTGSALAAPTPTPETAFLAQGYAQLAEQDTAAGNAFSLWGLLGSLALPVLLVIVCFVLAARGLRALNRRLTQASSSSGMLLILDSLPLGNAGTLFVVQLGERVMLLGASSQQLTLLRELQPEEAQALRAALLRPGEPVSGQLARRFRDLLRSQAVPGFPQPTHLRKDTPPPSSPKPESGHYTVAPATSPSSNPPTGRFGYHPSSSTAAQR